MQTKPKKNLILTINDKYSIEVDPRQYILRETKTNTKGQPYYYVHGNFTALDTLLMRLAKLRVSDKHNKLTVDTYIQLMRQELKQLTQRTTGL